MDKAEYPRGVKRPGRYAPIHFEWVKVVIEDTGESRMAMVALDDVAGRQCRERGYRPGDHVKAEIKQVRNLQFWRFVHLLGGWLADNVEDYEGLDSHEAVKKLQRDSGIGCDTTRSDVRDHDGKLLYRVVSHQPHSLAFDCMSEDVFRAHWDGGKEARGNGGWLGYLRRKVYAGMDAPSIDELERMIVGEVPAWVE